MANKKWDILLTKIDNIDEELKDIKVKVNDVDRRLVDCVGEVVKTQKDITQGLSSIRDKMYKGFKIIVALILGISIFFYVNMSKFHPKELQEATVSTLEQKALN